MGENTGEKALPLRHFQSSCAELKVNPIYARASKDNLASIRVLEKCGFKITGHGKGFANARGKEIEEVVLEQTIDV